ncbi:MULTISPECIES: Rrf2 family transcriptional regulator [Hyphomicrobiales]|uniref:BadM/Rrf2 family transcriptional regulator n=1 Tax=Aquamicrobium defluvii TaxID=69279 RepID=A0A4R6YE53_9HYPH|nr:MULTISPECIES: Rrf2 family transcriptional regulator [Hyphomicrobiales]NTD88294.1 Rrf2 family transcriptional regulator [Agrobacterium tumefaciens]NTD92603.1 Rrf2 family transcriptional regulator [Agrobacterium tumefaciens]NTE00932.1 Rrf2 family transcriptional regulator [Agrobacterium tumefaciens]NTE16846.1 Rrf2 family transcriptional regulator [Agrobacterium tumefaciens]NTE16911.1 Rrf2 family transcriptional regulator [Agrobacterium tumefaciens]
MKLQQATRAAIVALLHMASRPGEQIPASEIAEIYGMSQHHLAKVLRTLSLAGLAESTRGVGGGCSFVGDARKIALYDIIKLFEPDWFTSPDRPDAPSNVAAELFRVMEEIDRISAATLQSVTLQTIINNSMRRLRGAGDQPNPSGKAVT